MENSYFTVFLFKLKLYKRLLKIFLKILNSRDASNRLSWIEKFPWLDFLTLSVFYWTVERPVKGIREEGWGWLVHAPMSVQASMPLCLVIAGLQRGRQKHQSRDRWLCLSHPSLEGIQHAGWLNSSVGTLSLPAASMTYSSIRRRVFSHSHVFLPPSPSQCMAFELFVVVVSSFFPPFSFTFSLYGVGALYRCHSLVPFLPSLHSHFYNHFFFPPFIDHSESFNKHIWCPHIWCPCRTELPLLNIYSNIIVFVCVC